jgi:hypothetical protein
LKVYTACNLSSNRCGEVASKIAELHEEVLVNRNTANHFVLTQESMKSLELLYRKISKLLDDLEKQCTVGEVLSSHKTSEIKPTEDVEAMDSRLKDIKFGTPKRERWNCTVSIYFNKVHFESHSKRVA